MIPSAPNSNAFAVFGIYGLDRWRVAKFDGRLQVDQQRSHIEHAGLGRQHREVGMVEFRAAAAEERRDDHRHHHPVPLADPGRTRRLPRLLHAEWTKFRTVRGRVIGMAVAVLATGAGTAAAAEHRSASDLLGWFGGDRVVGSRWSELPGPVRAVAVVVPGVFGQHPAEMAFAEDQHPVGQLGPGGAHEPLRVGVRAGACGVGGAAACGPGGPGEDVLAGEPGGDHLHR
jgi:hypothetical protein